MDGLFKGDGGGPAAGGASLVAGLESFTAQDIPRAGGKGARLGELIRAGFAVPPGFVVTTEAYREASQAAGMSARLREEILRAWERLGSCPVAVRSSATAEDLPGAAFAGQQETFLNVTGGPEILRAVQACWASLWSERAVAYRARTGVESSSVAMAVVVQQMVPADAAGVLLPADPVTGERGLVTVDASPGLGESVVSGRVTPDRYRLVGRSLRVAEFRRGRGEVVIRVRPGGGTEETTGTAAAGAPAVPRRAVRRLARAGRRIERRFGAPQDIEWAWVRKGRAFLILQARPITALPEVVKLNAPMRALLPILMEMWQSRPYPLDMTTFTGALDHAIGDFLVSMLGSHAPNPRDALVEVDGVVVGFRPPAVRPSPSMVFSVMAAFRRNRRYRPEDWEQDGALEEVKARARELNATVLSPLSWSGVAGVLRRALALVPLMMGIRDRFVPPALRSLLGLWLRLALAGRRDRLKELLHGVETKTMESNRALEALADRIRQSARLAALFADLPPEKLRGALSSFAEGRQLEDLLAGFLAEYGHREVGLTVSQGSWRDRPEIVIAILKSLATASPGQRAGSAAREPEYPEPPTPLWERARDELLKGPLGWGPVRSGFRRALAGSRAFFRLREDTHFYATLALPIARRAVMEMGRRLHGAGILASPDDVFHLRREELEELGRPWPPPAETRTRLMQTVERRRSARDSLKDKPLFGAALVASLRKVPGAENVLLAGSPGSPGTARGPVRVVHGPDEFGLLRSGEVLVAPFTNPAWTPLFTRAAAIVVDAGGSASHAAIVAREYGVPAVMGTGDGTSRLADGQVVTVDGTTGVVLREEEA